MQRLGEHDQRGKLEKGFAAALWLLKKSSAGSRFLHVKEEVAGSTSWNKREKWSSKKLLKIWEEDEFEAHLASGRIRWRESPTTWGVWEYSDTQDLEKNFKVSKGRTTARGVEYDPEEEEEGFDSLWQANGHTGVLGLCQDGAKGSLGKGNTSKGLGKGQGLAKGQGKSQQLAIKDKEVEDKLGPKFPTSW